MSIVLCAISGIEFEVQYMPLYLTSRESHHPIFDLSPAKLLKLSERWVDQDLEPIESYLLYLALFKGTRRMEFRSPATYLGAESDAIVASNMERLVAIASRILASGEERVNSILHLPFFVITPDTKDFAGSPDWITTWEEGYKDYENNYISATLADKIARKEVNLERYIRDRTRDIKSYASQLADWAALAGNFPVWDAGTDMIKIMGKSCTLATYWKFIIKSCAAGESIWNIPVADIKELIEHCEDSIPHGSIFSHTLMTLLREGLDRITNFFNLGDIDLGRNGSVGFRILDATTSVEDANKLAIIESAPLNAPRESDYPNKLAFIKAKLAYSMKVNHDAELKENAALKSSTLAATPTLASKL